MKTAKELKAMLAEAEATGKNVYVTAEPLTSCRTASSLRVIKVGRFCGEDSFKNNWLLAPD